MLEKPKVSVIVPVYKAEAYLYRCVDSLLVQTFTNFEILLIDDGSPDCSGEICDEYARKDTRVRVFHKENGGVSSARNLGLKYAQGEWIAFVDSDDWVESDFLEVFRILSVDVDMIHCGLQLEQKPKKFVRYSIFRHRQQIKPSELLNPVYFSSCSVSYFYKRSLINNLGLKFCDVIKYSEDRQFIIKYLSSCSNNVLLIDNQAYRYCLNSSSAVHSERSYTRCLDDLVVLHSLKGLPLATATPFVFRLFVKGFILAYCIYCDKSKPDFHVAINDLIRYSEGYSHEYLLFQSFVKYPMLTVSAFKCYWWIRTIYHKMK